MTVSRHLNALEASGLIRLAQLHPELEYMFRHALVQDAAYTSLLKQERKQLHKAVGETLERLYATRLDELAGTLAYHFAQAGERDKGIAYARRAAQRAVAMYAYDQAVQHLRIALDLLTTTVPTATRVEILEEIADVHRLLREGRRSIQIYQEALDVWQSLVDADKLIGARLHRKVIEVLAEIKWSVGWSDFQEASQATLASRASLETGLALVQAQPPHAETVRLMMALSLAAWRIATPPDWPSAMRYAQAAVNMARQLNSPIELSAALDMLGTVYFAQGQLREHLDAALQRLQTTQDPEFSDLSAGSGQALRERLDSLRGGGSALMYVGDYAQAIPYLEEAERIAVRIQSVDQHFNALSILTLCWFRLDRWDEALETENRARDLLRQHSTARIGPICFPRAIASSIFALRGEFEQARIAQAESYDMMVVIAGPSESWPLRNAHY